MNTLITVALSKDNLDSNIQIFFLENRLKLAHLYINHILNTHESHLFSAA